MTENKQGTFGDFLQQDKDSNKNQLFTKFIIPPFSVLDTRQGYWQERKSLWSELGINSVLGRGENLLLPKNLSEEGMNHYRNAKKAQFTSLNIHKYDGNEQKYKSAQSFSQEHLNELMGARISETGTSIFDPVLCELMYKWFCIDKGEILDPFSGGSVRGIVASKLGYKYTGIDLSIAQIDANKEQGQKLCAPDNIPNWIQGNSQDMNELLPKGKLYDFVFSCPPYHDLEQYTDDKNDLSNMSWGQFKNVYADIINKAVYKLDYNRFACFVVSEIRNKEGFYKGFVPYTIECFEKAGAMFYNELILVNVAGSLPIRASAQFSGRKIGRSHQNILVFFNGSPDTIPDKYSSDINTGITG